MGELIVVYYFCFQAEDGRRDKHVTGVQTCALPIFAESLYTNPDLLGMWYLYFAVGLAAVCLGIPLYLVYRTDKRRKRAFDKRNKNADDMNDLDHY